MKYSTFKYFTSALLTMFFMCLFAVQANAQNKVSGTVKDQSGEALIGVNVMEKGTTNGAITDIDGNFSLTVKRNAILEISYIGYKTVAIPAKNGMVVTLQEDLEELEEVVVVGYGTARKKDLTGSVTQVKPENLAIDNPQSVQDVLRSTAGLNIGYSSDAAGGGRMSVRGQRSVMEGGGHNEPLVILDGMMFYGDLSEINTEDIAQLDVLKDASSAAVYGAKGANGVIVITTKKGRVGKPIINFNSQIGLMTRASYWGHYGPEEWDSVLTDYMEAPTAGADASGKWGYYNSGAIAGKNGYYRSVERAQAMGVDAATWRNYDVDQSDGDRAIWGRRLGYQKGTNIYNNFIAEKRRNWEDEVFRTGLNQNYNVSISGASDKANYYLSLGYMNNQGMRQDDDYSTIRANMKVNFKVNKYIELGANVNFQTRQNAGPQMSQNNMLRNNPYGDIYDEDGNPRLYPVDQAYAQPGYNWAYEKTKYELEHGSDSYNAIFNAKINLPFGIVYQFNASPRFQYDQYRYFSSSDRPDADPNQKGATRNSGRRFDWSLNNTLTWDKFINEVHHFTVTLVQEAEERRYWSDNLQAYGLKPSDSLGFHATQYATKDFTTWSSRDTHETATGYMGRLFYSYDDRYMITGSIRRDGYCAFGSSNPYATFPSIALGWTFSNEKFMQPMVEKLHMNNGKLRLSYGVNGNRSLGDVYAALANLGSSSYVQNYLSNSGELTTIKYLYVDRLANPKLKWEKTTSWNVGLDLGFFDGRITSTIDYYKMNTTDMIMGQKLPRMTGFDSVTTNLGEVTNDGLEISINTQNIKKKNFQWNSSFSFTWNKNRIKHLYYEYDENGKELDDIDNRWFIGKPINEIWMYKTIGTWQADEWQEAAKYAQQPGDPKVEDVNNDGVYNDDDRQFLGQTTHPIHVQLRNEFVIKKNWTLAFNVYGNFGGKQISNYFMNNFNDGGQVDFGLMTPRSGTYWTIENPTNDFLRIGASVPKGVPALYQVYNASHIRFENVSAAYNIPSKALKKLGIEKARIFVTVKNLGLVKFSKTWEYGDIETYFSNRKGGRSFAGSDQAGSGYYGGSNRTYTFGVSLTL